MKSLAGIRTLLIYFYLLLLLGCGRRDNKIQSEENHETMRIDTIMDIGKATMTYTPKTRFVLYQYGAALYESASIESNVVYPIPLGGKIELIEGEHGKKLDLNGYKGYLLQATFQGKKGFVFSGYLGHYPKPSFAVRDFYTKGDLESYANELNGMGFDITYEEKLGNNLILHFPLGGVNELFLTAKLLFPELLMTDDQGVDIVLKERDLDQVLNFGVDPQNRPHWGGADVYETSGLAKDSTLLYYSYYFKGEDGEAQMNLIEEKRGCTLEYDEYNSD